jgi:hypothetical protein
MIAKIFFGSGKIPMRELSKNIKFGNKKKPAEAGL